MDEAIGIAATLAKHFEGFRTRPYHDPVGFPTDGYGRLLSRTPWADLSQWPDVTEAEAAQHLAASLISFSRSVARLCPVPLEPHQVAALIDFAYNCGAGNLQSSRLRACVNRGDHEEAANQFGRWVYARGVKLPGLVRRRQAEANLYRGVQ